MSNQVETGKVISLDQVFKQSRKTGKQFAINYVELDSGARINVGYDQPYTVGQSVTLPVEFTYGELQVPRNSASGAKAGAGQVSTTTKTKGADNRAPYGRNNQFPVPGGHGDISIMRQNALTNANTLLVQGSFVDATIMELDEAVEVIIATAYKFCEFTTGHREERMAKEAVKVAKALAEDEE